jgi:DNA-binding NarL/FixJ family response regulator
VPVLDGIEATRRIVAARPETQVVVLTSFSDRVGILGALDAGAVGYLLKDAEPEELMHGIRAAARGESPLAPKAAKTVLSARTEQRRAEELTETGARRARADRRRAVEQADRATAGHQREDGEGARDKRVPPDRRRRPHAGCALGEAARAR